MTADAAGGEEGQFLEHEAQLDHEPCLLPSCDCCTKWTRSLELLRAHAIFHTKGEVRSSPCSPACLICAEIDWQERDRV